MANAPSPYGGPALTPGARPEQQYDTRYWQRGSIRQPPGWSPQVQSSYPFRSWMHDVLAWSFYTDLHDTQKGPATELVLGGTANDYIRALPLDHKINGCMFDPGDGGGARRHTGLEFIVAALARNFAHFDEEEAARSMLELWQFRRRPGESMDAYLARFTLVHHRSSINSGQQLSPGQQCFTLMNGMGMSQREMWDCLRTLNGQLPQDEVQLQHIHVQLRRYGHLVEEQERSRHPPQHFPTVADANHDSQSHNVDVSVGYPGAVSSPLLRSSGASGAAAANSGGTSQNMQENWALDDDNDTSDEESDCDDHHPDPHPAEPDMTGWSTNQIGGYFLPKVQAL